MAERHDLREAWIALAGAHHRAGDQHAAAAALAAALSSHIGPIGAPLRSLADGIAAASGAAGWCGLTRHGAGLPAAAARAGLALGDELRADSPRDIFA